MVNEKKELCAGVKEIYVTLFANYTMTTMDNKAERFRTFLFNIRTISLFQVRVLENRHFKRC